MYKKHWIDYETFIYCNITPNQSRLGVYHAYFFPQFEPTDFLLVAVFFFNGFLDITPRFFCLTLTFFFGFRFRLGFFFCFFSGVFKRFFAPSKIKFTSSQVSWFGSYNGTKIWWNCIPENVIFKNSEVWRKQAKLCVYHW